MLVYDYSQAEPVEVGMGLVLLLVLTRYDQGIKLWS